MSDDTSAALIAQLDVKFDQLASNMKKALTVFDNGGKALEKRQAEIKKKLSDWAIDFSGIGGINKAVAGLTGVAIVGGIADLVKKSLEAAAAIGDVATQSGVSVEFLQKLRFAASQSGASFDVLDEGLSTLNKTFGDFVNTGAGKGAQTFKTLGIDKLIKSGDVRDTEELFNVVISKLQGVGSEAQKSAYLASLFGKEAGPKLLQLVNQGTEGLARLEAQAVSLGIVLSTKTVNGAKEANDKLTALFSVMKAEGVAAVASLAPEIANLAQQITNGLPDLITWVEKWAAFFGLINLTPVQQAKVQIQGITASLAALQKQKADITENPTSLKALFGPSQGEFDTLIGSEQQRLADAQAALTHAQGLSKTTHGHHLPIDQPLDLPTGRRPALKINDIQGDKDAAKLAEQQKQAKLQAAEALAKTVTDAKTAQAALLAAQDQTSLQLLKGSAGYQAALQKQIDDEYNSKVSVYTAERDVAQAGLDKQREELAKRGVQWQGYATAVFNINEKMNADIAAADQERAQKRDEANGNLLVREAVLAGNDQVKQYQDETAVLGQTAGAVARLVFMQNALNEARKEGKTLTADQISALEKESVAVGNAAQAAHDAQVEINKSIEVGDELRSGLEDVFAAGLQGFGSLKDAAASFLQELAAMILKLYVIRPLLESVLGQPGTTFGSSGGGGIFGGLESLFGGGGGVGEANGGGDFIGSASDTAGFLSFVGFDSGGYTGDGGKMQPAGIVHKGEGVLTQEDIANLGGPRGFTKFRAALKRGYADGGMVGTSIPSIGPMPKVPTVTAPRPHAAAYFDLRGAVLTQDLLNQMNQISRRNSAEAGRSAYSQAVAESDRRTPANLRVAMRDYL